MHVLVIPSWYPTSDNPARGSFFREQARALARANVRVGVLVIPTRVRTWHGLAEVRQARGRAPQLVRRDDAGLPTYQLDWWGWLPSLLPERRLDRVLAAFDRYVDEQGPVDVVHAHGALYAGYVAAHLREQRGVPVVLTEHLTALVSGRIFPDQRARAARAIVAADRCLAVGEVLAQALRQLAPGVDVSVVGNAVDGDFFAPPPLPLARSPFRFSVVCGLEQRKGVDVLIRAFQRAFLGQPVELRIAGVGSERAALERLVAASGLAEQVRFLGGLSRCAVRDLLQQSHALVSSSYLETFGVTLIEAMACGLPVVATRSGGPESFVTTASGLLVPPGDPDQLATALTSLVRDYEAYDRSAIRRDCIARFGEAAIVGRLSSIYADLTRANPRLAKAEPGHAKARSR